MNVNIIDALGLHVWVHRKHTNVNGYRMFETVLVIFTETNFYNPVQFN